MRIPVRWRVVIACLATGIVGHFAADLVSGLRGHVTCYSLPVRAVHFCTATNGLRPGVRWASWVTLGIVVVAACWVLAVWSLRGVARLTDTVRRLGPQNLAERIDVPRRQDEVGVLAGALNAMMNRLAAGYEGQRSFAANASHELRTPLALQRTLIEVGMTDDLSPPQLELLTRQLLHTNERNEALIEGLLVLSESDRGLATSTPQRLDHIAAAVVASHQELAAKAGVELGITVEPKVVTGEQVLLERLVTNLIANAVKYNNPAGGIVRVTVAATEPALVVVNTGPAVPAESIPGLFEPFRRLASDRVHHGGGSGLGLTIARSICQAHHATIDATGRAGGGLEVRVTFG